MEYSNKEIDRQIMEIGSKHCKPILWEVRDNEGITHAELAKQLNLLPSGLSGVTKKMVQCDIQLLLISQTGKYKKYTLPEYIKRYLSEEQLQNNCRVQEKEENLFLLLQRFVEAAGVDWKEELNLLLQSEDVNGKSNMERAFLQFMKLYGSKQQQKDESVFGIQTFIENEVLLYLLNQYVEASQ